MSQFEESIVIDVAPEVLFDYLCDVHNLPEYMPRMSAVQAHEDGTVTVTAQPRIADGTQVEVTGTAWIKAEDGMRMTWGALANRHDYTGEFDVEPADGSGGAASRLFVRLQTSRTRGHPVERGLSDVLTRIKGIAEAWPAEA